MKKITMIFFSVFLICCCTAQKKIDEMDIWGVWNADEVSDDLIKFETPTGVYLRTFNFLLFENTKDYSRICYEGGFYIIRNVSRIDNHSFKIVVEYEGYKKNMNKWEKGKIKGEINMHFVTKDIVWFELIEGSRTDESFTKADFKGKNTKYWRAKKTK